MKKFEFRMSPEPLVSCAQAPPPAKGYDGLWGRECLFPGRQGEAPGSPRGVYFRGTDNDTRYHQGLRSENV